MRNRISPITCKRQHIPNWTNCPLDWHFGVLARSLRATWTKPTCTNLPAHLEHASRSRPIKIWPPWLHARSFFFKKEKLLSWKKLKSIQNSKQTVCPIYYEAAPAPNPKYLEVACARCDFFSSSLGGRAHINVKPFFVLLFPSLHHHHSFPWDF